MVFSKIHNLIKVQMSKLHLTKTKNIYMLSTWISQKKKTITPSNQTPQKMPAAKLKIMSYQELVISSH